MPPKSPKSNLNNASHNQLMKVAGIGKILAKRLKEHMPFDNWADVEHIPDVGPVRVARLKSFLKLSMTQNTPMVVRMTVAACARIPK